MLEQIAAEYRGKARLAGLDLSADIDPQLPPVRANPIQLYRVIGHLLSNAVKFTPAGGSIFVVGRCASGQVEIEVTDTGLGIPKEEHERIFQRFYQVDGSPTRRHPGMGLGLALVKETVESMGGKVMVDSAIGCGSSFKVKLPLQRAALNPLSTLFIKRARTVNGDCMGSVHKGGGSSE
jgi:signal transduction histidine kinase